MDEHQIYEHQWYRPLDLDGERYAAFVQDCRRFLQHVAVYHREHPASQELVRVQEQMEYTLEKGHLFFRMGPFQWEDRRSSRTPSEQRHPEHNPWCWHRCATRRPRIQLPYDLIVCVLLIAFKQQFPEVTLVSDAEPSQWSEAVDWYHACFPERTVPPGPWSPERAASSLDKVVVLNRQAQQRGYGVARERGLLIVFARADRHNRQGKNQLFLDDARGQDELAGWIRHLADTQAIIYPGEEQWRQWSHIFGCSARWTGQIAEQWHSTSQEYIDLRKIEAQDGSEKHAWVPRRALATFIGTPADLKDYQLQLLEKQGQVCAVRVEQRWSGYNEPRNPQRLAFSPIAIILAMPLIIAPD